MPCRGLVVVTRKGIDFQIRSQSRGPIPFKYLTSQTMCKRATNTSQSTHRTEEPSVNPLDSFSIMLIGALID